MTAPKRRAAKRPAPRMVTATITKGDFTGWEATARADFPAGDLAALQSGELEKIITVLERIITDHNMPNAQDEIAASIRDVDPYDGLFEISAAIFDAIGNLPNR